MMSVSLKDYYLFNIVHLSIQTLERVEEERKKGKEGKRELRTVKMGQ